MLKTSSDNAVADRIFIRFLTANRFIHWLVGKFVRPIDIPLHDPKLFIMVCSRDFTVTHAMEEFLILADMVSNSTQTAEDPEINQC